MAMTGAERQRLYMERLKAGAKPAEPKTPRDYRSRPQRWRDAVAALLEIQEQYGDWHENLPENLKESVTAELLRAIMELDIESLLDVEFPRGYGRDT